MLFVVETEVLDRINMLQGCTVNAQIPTSDMETCLLETLSMFILLFKLLDF